MYLQSMCNSDSTLLIFIENEYTRKEVLVSYMKTNSNCNKSQFCADNSKYGNTFRNRLFYHDTEPCAWLLFELHPVPFLPEQGKTHYLFKKKKKFVHSLFTLRWIKSFIKSNIERMREIYNCIIFLYIPALQFFYLFFINCLICCLPIWYL